MEIIERELGRIKDLPTVPAVLRQVSALIEKNETDMKKIADVIMTDTALTIRIIRLVNSAFYGLQNRITSISQAVVIVGLKAVYNLMLGLSVVKLFNNEKSLYFDPNQLWRHSFGCALLSNKIAALVAYPYADECFIGGLLHDMGRLVFDQFFHDAFAGACRNSMDRKVSLLKSEKTMIGFDHAEAGAWLAARLNIPASYVAAVRYHHAPALLPQGLATYGDMVRIVATANHICMNEGVGKSGEIHFEPVAGILSPERLGISEPQLAASAAAEIDTTIERWSS
jgi:putative nucleotidyltransferase with HDIG domain